MTVRSSERHTMASQSFVRPRFLPLVGVSPSADAAASDFKESSPNSGVDNSGVGRSSAYFSQGEGATVGVLSIRGRAF